MTDSPWLTTHEACDYLRYQGRHRLRSLYKFLAKNGVPIVHRSPKRLLVARADLDRALGVAPTRLKRSA